MFPQLDHPILPERLASELEAACLRARLGVPHRIQIDHELTVEHTGNLRRYAAVTAKDPHPTFYFAEQTLWLPFPHRMGLYAHEIGHVIDPDPEKTEDGADLHGMLALDLLIMYDHRWPGKGLQVAAW